MSGIEVYRDEAEVLEAEFSALGTPRKTKCDYDSGNLRARAPKAHSIAARRFREPVASSRSKPNLLQTRSPISLVAHVDGLGTSSRPFRPQKATRRR